MADIYALCKSACVISFGLRLTIYLENCDMSAKLRKSLAVSVLFVLVGSVNATLAGPNHWTLASPNSKLSISIVQKVLGEPYPSHPVRKNALPRGRGTQYITRLESKAPPVGLRRASPRREFSNVVYYCVEHNGDEVLPYAPLGVTMSAADSNFVSDLAFVSQSDRVIDETYPMITGKKSVHRNHANEKTLVFKNLQGNIVHIVFRACNDGIAYRYYFPGTGSREIIAESSGFKVPSKSVGWLQKYKPNYEDYYLKETDIAAYDGHDIGFPALFHTPAGVWILLTEAAVYGDYAGSRLTVEKGSFRVKLPDKVSGELPWTTPWRVAIIGKDLGTIVESVLVDNLNPPCEVKDLSWIKPGRVAFPWWSDHNANSEFEKLEPFVDLAHEMGWEWMEFATGLVSRQVADAWMTTPWVPKLMAYARNKGVKVYGWEIWRRLDTPQEREKRLGMLKKFGFKGIKVDYLDSDSQKMFRFRDEIIKACLERKLMVSFHGATIPRGQRRRWPHIITWEAAMGAEYYTFGDKPPTPRHNCTLPFTRNVLGPMDYTPVTFSAKGRITTDAHELALSVIFESGWQNISDAPGAYAASPGKLFLKQVHAAWDDIHFIDGFPGEFVCLARRKGNDWFIAAINAETARTVTIPLDFLKQGTYSIKLYKDNCEGKGIAVEDLTLDTSKPLEVYLPSNSGFCTRIANSYNSQVIP
jgi:alpha-glucosidase